MWLPESRALHIGLSAHHLMVAKTGGLWPGRHATCDRIDCAPVADDELWRPAVTALAQRLAEHVGKKPTLHIVLSGRFVRWQLLPWRPELTRAHEVSTYAALRFRETFGKVAEGWQVLHASQALGKTVPACAVDAALIAALRSTCEAAGARLAAVTPYYASVFDRWRNALGKKTVWFGLIEPDCISLGLLQAGSWMGLHTQRLDGDWREVLPGMLAQLGIGAGLTEEFPPLYLVGDGEQPLPVAGLACTWLCPAQPAQRALVGWRMALGV